MDYQASNEIMSKKELKTLQKQLNHRIDTEGVTLDFQNHHRALEPTLNELERAQAERHNTANEKDYEWMKWLIVIASGVFSVIISQVARMSSSFDSGSLFMQSSQLPLFKVAIIANALGVILGAVYLYTDVKSERDLTNKLGIQQLYLLLNGTNRYKNVIPSENFRLFFCCKIASLFCFLVSIGAWIVFIWMI